ncbi:MAG: DUF5606 domain-containing protein [Bacteroidota bacterium]
MDLSKIMSISGRPGLFKLVGQTKSGAIVESLLDQKRFPVFPHDKISSLEEISIFTTEEDVPLKEVLKKISEKEIAGTAPDSKITNDALWKYFGEVLPEFDKDRVYASDIRKVISWYNLLLDKGLLDFTEEEVVAEEITEETPAVDDQANS